MPDDVPNLYQSIRTLVKKQLHHVIDLVGMEYAIRAATDASLEETERALRSHLTENGLHIVAEVDVQEVHNHYDLEYPGFKILKIAAADDLGACPIAGRALEIDPGTSALLPPGIVLYETPEGGTRVSALRPSTLLALYNDAELRDLVQELEGIFWNALEKGIPRSTMLSEEPPILPGSNGRATIKKALHPVLGLLDAEFTFHVSTDAPREEVVASLRDSMALRGQHVLAEVAGGGVEILLVVNAGQAHKLLAIEPDVGVFAPLSVGIYEQDGRTHVRTVRPSTLLIFFTNPAMQDMIQEMEMLLWSGLVKAVPGGKIHSRQPPLPAGTGQRTTGAGLPGGLDSFKRYRPG